MSGSESGSVDAVDQPPALLDVDTPEYVTLARACEITGRSERTILRWYAAGKVERTWRWHIGEPVYNRWDLEIALSESAKRQRSTQFAGTWSE